MPLSTKVGDNHEVFRALTPVPSLDTQTPAPKFIFRGQSDESWGQGRLAHRMPSWSVLPGNEPIQ